METTTIDWGDIAARHADRIFRAARVFAPDDDLAWDCVQQALLVAVTSRRAIRRPVEWLCGVAANRARHECRSRSRWREVLARFVRQRPPRPARIHRPSSAAPDLDGALGRLSPKLRDAVILRYLAGMSVAEVARAQGVSESAAKMRVHRGLAALRRVLGAAALLVLLTRRTGTARAATLLETVSSGGALATACAVAATAAKAKTLLLLGMLLLAGGTSYFAFRDAPEGTPDPRPTPPAGALAPAVPGSTGEQATTAATSVPTVTDLRATACGTVLSPAGKPVAGARVTFALAVGPTTCPEFGSAAARTDADGSFRLAGLPPGIDLVVVAAKRPYRKTASDAFALGEGDERDGILVHLLPGSSLTGRVVDDEGAPVAGASITVTTGNTTRWVGGSVPALLPEGATTDAAGGYEITGLEERMYRVFAEKPGYLPVHRWGTMATAEGGRVPDLVLRKGVGVEGVTVDAAGNPVAGASVSIVGPGGSGGQARTDAQGRFRIDTVVDGPHTLYAGAMGMPAIEPREIEIPMVGPLRIVLGLGSAAVEGIAWTREGSPARAVVDAWLADGRHLSVIADPEGRFRFAGLPDEGSITLSVQSRRPLFPDVTVPTTTRETIELMPVEPTEIGGQVLGPDGAPVRGARVRVTAADGSHRPERTSDAHRYRQVTTDVEGRFRIGKLAAARFLVCADGRGALPANLENVPPGSVNLVLRLEAGLSISGRVLFGGPEPKGWCGIEAKGPDGTRRVAGVNREDGSFVLTGLVPGAWSLSVSLPGYRRSAGEVAAGTAGVTIAVPAWEEIPLSDLRLPVPEGTNTHFWRTLWQEIDRCGIRDRAALVAAVPVLAGEGTDVSPDVLAKLLRRIGTPDATDALVGMFLAPGERPSGWLRAIAPHLMEIEDPRIGPAARRWFRWLVDHDRTSWVTMDPIADLLARHGDDEGVLVLAGLLEGDLEVSPQAVLAAAKALRHARSPRLLEAGLTYIVGIRSPGRVREVADALVEAFGDRARVRLEPLLEKLEEGERGK